MTGREQFVDCPEDEYKWALAHPIEARQLKLGNNRLYFYLRRRDGEKTIKGPVYATPEKLGSLAVTITLLDQDLDNTNEVFFGFMPAGIWNIQPGRQGIVFEHGIYRFETYDGILQPYSDGFDDNDVEFLHRHTNPKFDPPKPPFVAQ